MYRHLLSLAPVYKEKNQGSDKVISNEKTLSVNGTTGLNGLI